jgi:hypothetical protein
MSSFETDLSNSTTDFERAVAPVLKEWTGGRNISVEASTDSELADELDQTAGVDAWNIKSDDIVRGVGSRIQYLSTSSLDTPADTFTVRKERQSGARTEYEKRLHAIQNGGVYPYWTTQAYLSEPQGELLSLARVRTKDLIYHIKDGEEGAGKDYRVVEPGGEASFFVVNWWRLQEVGVGVRETKPYKQESQEGREKNQQQKGLFDFATDGGQE